MHGMHALLLMLLMSCAQIFALSRLDTITFSQSFSLKPSAMLSKAQHIQHRRQ